MKQVQHHYSKPYSSILVPGVKKPGKQQNQQQELKLNQRQEEFVKNQSLQLQSRYFEHIKRQRTQTHTTGITEPASRKIYLTAKIEAAVEIFKSN